RADLYFRLAVVPVTVPPLRERPEDIVLLVRAIVDEVGRKMGRRIEAIDEGSLAALRRYPWPGNVRELRNVVERAIILGGESTLWIELPEHRAKAINASLTLEDMERHHIVQILDRTGWRLRGTEGAAKVLGLPPSTLETRMAKLGIRRPPSTPVSRRSPGIPGDVPTLGRQPAWRLRWKSLHGRRRGGRS